MTTEHHSKELAVRLTEIRLKRGMSQAAVAAAVGLPFRVTVTKIENGQRAVSALELARLAALYRTTPNRLLKGLEVAP